MALERLRFLREIADIAKLVENAERKPAKRGAYNKRVEADV